MVSDPHMNKARQIFTPYITKIFNLPKKRYQHSISVNVPCGDGLRS